MPHCRENLCVGVGVLRKGGSGDPLRGFLFLEPSLSGISQHPPHPLHHISHIHLYTPSIRSIRCTFPSLWT